MAPTQEQLQRIETASDKLAPTNDKREFNRVLRSKSAEYEKQVLNEVFDALGLDPSKFSKFDGKDRMSPKEILTVREIQRRLEIDVDGDVGAATKKAIYDFAHKGLDKFRAEVHQKEIAGVRSELTAEQGAHTKTKKELTDERSAHGKTKEELEREKSGEPGTKHGETRTELNTTKENLKATTEQLIAEQDAAPGTNHAKTKYLKSEEAEKLRLDQNLRKATSSGFGSLPGGWDRYDAIVSGSAKLKSEDVKKFEKAFIDQAAHVLAREEAIKSGKRVTNGDYEKMAEKHAAALTKSVTGEADVTKRLESVRATAAKSMDYIVDNYCRKAGLKPEKITVTSAEGADSTKEVFRLTNSTWKEYEVASKINSRVDHDNAVERFFFRLVGRNVTERPSKQQPAGQPTNAQQVQQQKPVEQPATVQQVQQQKPAEQPATVQQVQQQKPVEQPATVQQVQQQKPVEQPATVQQQQTPKQVKTLTVEGLPQQLSTALGHGPLLEHLEPQIKAGEVKFENNKLTVTYATGAEKAVLVDTGRLFSKENGAAEADRILKELLAK